MGRWKPDAPARLQQAAFELCSAQGYDQTTVAAIAAEAGLTERTFFRHFADKREALFQGGELFATTIVNAIVAAPASEATLETVLVGIKSGASLFPTRDMVRRRQQLIAANSELLERELSKLHSLAGSISEALRSRGVPPRAAELAGETGITVLRVALARWVESPAELPFDIHADQVVDELRHLS